MTKVLFAKSDVIFPLAVALGAMAIGGKWSDGGSALCVMVGEGAWPSKAAQEMRCEKMPKPRQQWH
jgi:hypothetical protein